MQEQAKESKTRPPPLLGVPQKLQTKQPQCIAEALAATVVCNRNNEPGSVRLWQSIELTPLVISLLLLHTQTSPGVQASSGLLRQVIRESVHAHTGIVCHLQNVQPTRPGKEESKGIVTPVGHCGLSYAVSPHAGCQGWAGMLVLFFLPFH